MSEPTPPFEPAHRLFEIQAAQDPDRIAVRYRDQELTYGGLERSANHLARALRRRGVGAERRVAVYLEPGLEIAAALLGVLAAGGVYVPVDPSLPSARVHSILEHVRPDLVVCNSSPEIASLLGDWPRFELAGGKGGAVVEAFESTERETDEEESEYAKEAEVADRASRLSVTADQTACIFYTSGTTGLPKGVMATHANLSAYLRLARDRYRFGRDDAMPAIARFGFSISLFELLSPLTSGGTLFVLDRDHVMNPERMAKTLRQVTCFHAGPSLMKHLVAYLRKHEPDLHVFSGVRHASLGGDTVAPELLEAVKEVFPSSDVFVIYGCTEISCMGCTYEVPRSRRVERTYVGGPFDNVVVEVRSGQSQRLARGEAGEIWIAGPGVTKGYWADPESTSVKFVSIDGMKYYRTGDIGRWSDDGWLELLGRSDFQVKIRGMRLELGDVERSLRSAPGVKDGVVVAVAAVGDSGRTTGIEASGRTVAAGQAAHGQAGDAHAAAEEADQEKMLVAYFVAQTDGLSQKDTSLSNQTARTAAIRRHMAEQLPDYMVPAAYVELAALPLNANLKVDRRSLPPPNGRALRRFPSSETQDALTPTQAQLVSIVSEILGGVGVTREDNFFELGGDSILGLRFLCEVERVIGVRLSGMDVLRESIEVLAAICERRLGTRHEPEVAREGNERGIPRRCRLSESPPVEAFFFGREKHLYGLFHPAATGKAASAAVLICSAMGQEAVRSHFVVNSLARRLSRQGVPVMRFDYFGTLDSFGESKDADCERWQNDIDEAFHELVHRAATKRIEVVAVRLGAVLACHALARETLARVVFWDPVWSGSQYLARLSVSHQACLRDLAPLRGLRRARAPRGVRELLGTTYSEGALSQLERLSLIAGWFRTPHPIRCLSTSGGGENVAGPGGPPGSRSAGQSRSNPGNAEPFETTTLDVDCRWEDPGSQEQIMPDVGISAALLRMVMDARPLPSTTRKHAATSTAERSRANEGILLPIR